MGLPRHHPVSLRHWTYLEIHSWLLSRQSLPNLRELFGLASRNV